MIAAWRPLLVKELRALLPIWVAAAAAMFLARFSIPAIGLLVYLVGAAALGAFSIGHEYTYRTTGLLLAQPSRRELLLGAKAIALVAFILALACVARLVAINWTALRNGGDRAQLLADASLAIPAVLAISAAPLLTMLSRSAIAGTVFTIAIPGLLIAIGQRAGTALHGYSSASDTVALEVLFAGVALISVAGAVAALPRFMRLEVIEGRSTEIRSPFTGRHGAAAAHSGRFAHPVWKLVGKELRLQQLPFAVALIFLLITIGTARAYAAGQLENAFDGLTLFYAAMNTVLIGAFASAEERHLGTCGPQLLLPVAAWIQWTIKLAVLFTLAGALSWALPVGLAYAAPTLLTRATVVALHQWPTLVGLVFLLSASIYLSSLGATGIQAFVISLPVVLGLPVALASLQFVVLRRFMPVPAGGYGLLMIQALGTSAIPTLWFAYQNHKYLVRERGTYARQVAWTAAWFIAMLALPAFRVLHVFRG